ncbi:hypothetical protein IJF81_04790, partial [bacterium]|nr:hypothetical protein [bacterium]
MGLQKVAFNFMVERGGKLAKSLLCHSKPPKVPINIKELKYAPTLEKDTMPLSQAVGKHKIPRYLYHITSKENYNKIIQSGGITPLEADSFCGTGIFMLELENFFKNWQKIKVRDKKTIFKKKNTLYKYRELMKTKMVSQLFVKNIGKVLKPWYKQIKAYSDLPSGIHTYDVVKGFSGKKGNFEILSYKNKDGKLLQRVTTYTDKKEVITKNFTYDNELTYINTRTTRAGELQKNEYKTLCKYDNGSFVELTEDIGTVPSLDKQMARYLRPKQTPHTINVEDPWGNTKITSPKCSVGRMTMLKDRQYLPTAISNCSKERTNERIKNIEKVLANRNTIPVERTNTQRVSQRVLNPQADGTYYGQCFY